MNRRMIPVGYRELGVCHVFEGDEYLDGDGRIQVWRKQTASFASYIRVEKVEKADETVAVA